MDVDTFSPTRFTDSRTGPFREPDRHWRRCQYLMEHGRQPIPDLDHAVVCEAWRFANARNQCRTEAELDQLKQSFPAVADAHNFHVTAEPLRRDELEARLLAKETDEEIAAKIDGISPAGVGVYHELFFCVRPRLKAFGYITNMVLKCSPADVVAEDDQATWLRRFAFHFGSAGVDQIIEYFRNPPVIPKSLAELDDDALEVLRKKLAIRETLLGGALPIADMATCGRLLKRPAGLGGHSSNEFAPFL